MGEDNTKKPIVIAMTNQKGGVGKTTTSVNVAAFLSDMGKNVLLIDLDPQANTSSGLGIIRDPSMTTVYNALFDYSKSAEAIIRTKSGVYVLPSIPELAAAEVELVSLPEREFRLKKMIEGFGFDYIIIDCPPSLGILTINALAAADFVVVPVQSEYYALEGLGHLLHSMNMVKSSINPSLDLLGIVVTMYDVRTTLSAQVVGELNKHFPGKVFDSYIPRNVRIAEAPSFGKTIQEHDKWSKGSRSYKRLTKEIYNRIDTLSGG